MTINYYNKQTKRYNTLKYTLPRIMYTLSPILLGIITIVLYEL
jgi:hypothetical protein